MSGPVCQFDAATHTYRINGRPVPSVTQVLNDLLPCYQSGEWYLQRGTAVHACAALIAQGVEFEHDPAIDGQVRALRRFFAEVKPLVLDCERAMYSERYQFAGTLDLLASIVGNSPRIGGTSMLIDFKASESAALPYQLGGYAVALDDAGVGVRRGCGVIIREDGTYSMTKVYDLRQYQRGFLALLAAYNIRRDAGIKQQETEA